MSIKTIRAEMGEDGDTREQTLIVYLGTKSEGAGKIIAERLIRTFNNALKAEHERKKAARKEPAGGKST